MMEITNISGGLIVCDLKSGETLRLNNKATITLNDGDVTRHIENLAAKGKIRIKKMPAQQKVAAQKKGKEE